MKIKGVIKNLKINMIKNGNSKNIAKKFSGVVEGSVGGISSVSDSSFFQLVFLAKVYRPPPILSHC